MIKVLVDTDVILDLLAERHPHYIHAAKLFHLAQLGEVELYVSAISFATLFYLLNKQLNRNKAIEVIANLKTIVKVASVTDTTIEKAILSGFKDFEDAIQYFSGEENAASIIVTRNGKDYKSAKLPIMTAEAFLATLG